MRTEIKLIRGRAPAHMHLQCQKHVLSDSSGNKFNDIIRYESFPKNHLNKFLGGSRAAIMWRID